VVLATETLKLLLSCAGYLARTVRPEAQPANTGRLLLLYLLPAGLYCLSNNLSFLSLSYFNPTTYFMFLQSRLLLTGLVYQILFSRRLSRPQWVSLALLTLGCTLHGSSLTPEPAASTATASLTHGLLTILAQVLCSVLAGVTTELLIKGRGAGVDIVLQNILMYLDSILCNILLLWLRGDLATILTVSTLASLGRPELLALILLWSLLGLLTSVFLQRLNSILKAFATATELLLTALVSWPVLGIPLTLHTVGPQRVRYDHIGSPGCCHDGSICGCADLRQEPFAH
jgi:hypothetical protein